VSKDPLDFIRVLPPDVPYIFFHHPADTPPEFPNLKITYIPTLACNPGTHVIAKAAQVQRILDEQAGTTEQPA